MHHTGMDQISVWHAAIDVACRAVIVSFSVVKLV